MLKKVISLLLLPAMLCGCAAAPAVLDEPALPTAPAEAVETPVAAQAGAPLEAAFDFALLREALRQDKTNAVLSPLSAYYCLALMMNGANGETLRECERVMGGTTEAVNAYCAALKDALTATGGSTQLAIANSAWVDEGKVTLDAAYKTRIEEALGAEVFAADLPTMEAMQAINQWVSDNTRAMIPTVLSQPLDADAAAALFNTVYFKGKWSAPFDANKTYDRAFTKADGTVAQTPFMDGSGMREYIQCADAEGIVLPYDDGRIAFVALRPTNGEDARDFAAELTAQRLADYREAAKSTDIFFHMPKYTVTFEIGMNEMLKAMGLETMFDSRADLSGVGTPVAEPLFVSSVFQKVKVVVDEEGTEAAAVTGMIMTAMAMLPEEKPTLDLDSPFVYAVVDTVSGVPLFIGVLDDPTV